MISKGKFQKLPTVGPLTFPYYPLKYGNGMGSLWEGSLTIGDPWKNPVMKLLKKKHVNLGVGNVKKNRILINTLNGLPIHVFWQLTLNDLFANIA